MEIREIRQEELDGALALIWDVFEQFVAKDYSKQGCETFYNSFICNADFKKKLQTGAEVMYGAYVDGRLAGVVSVSKHNMVSCLFVRSDYHRRGIGALLLHTVIEVLKNRDVHVLRLNASPYGLPFYRRMGFLETGEQAEHMGIIYTPMELNF